MAKQNTWRAGMGGPFPDKGILEPEHKLPKHFFVCEARPQ